MPGHDNLGWNSGGLVCNTATEKLNYKSCCGPYTCTHCSSELLTNFRSSWAQSGWRPTSWWPLGPSRRPSASSRKGTSWRTTRNTPLPTVFSSARWSMPEGQYTYYVRKFCGGLAPTPPDFQYRIHKTFLTSPCFGWLGLPPPYAAWLPDGYSRIFRSYVLQASGLWLRNAPLCCKIWSLPFLGLRPTPSTLVRKPRKGTDQILQSGNTVPHHVRTSYKLCPHRGSGEGVQRHRLRAVVLAHHRVQHHHVRSMGRHEVCQLQWECARRKMRSLLARLRVIDLHRGRDLNIFLLGFVNSRKPDCGIMQPSQTFPLRSEIGLSLFY